jgi:hypothetical protein
MTIESRSRGRIRQDVGMSKEAATGPLYDAVALWESRSTFGVDEVISAATDALVAGLDSPSLRELAGASAKADYWTLRPLVEATLDELEISYPGPSNDEVQIAAARVMSKRLLAGSLTARDFAAWAHSTIGHEGPSRLQPIVELDDAYDMCEYTGGTLDNIEAAARREAKSLLAGEHLPARSTPSQPDQITANAGAESRLRSAWRRARGHLGR